MRMFRRDRLVALPLLFLALASVVAASCWVPTTTTSRSRSHTPSSSRRISIPYSSTALAASRKQNSVPKKKKQQQQQQQLLSPEEIAHHVSSMYIHGPRGSLRETKRRTIHEDHHPTGDNNSSSQDYLHKLDRHPALVLNADYQPLSYLPLSLWHWQEAIKAVFSGKVTVVDVYQDTTVRAVTMEIPLPSVIALNDYVPIQQHQQQPAFTRRNVFLRDEYRCQYCRQHFHTRDLSLDHVVPRCQGGRLHWENVVTSCTRCNGQKGSRTLQEISPHEMKLLRPPRVPSQYELAVVAGRMLPRKVHPTWEPYLKTSSTSTRSRPVWSSEDRDAASSSFQSETELEF